MQAIVPAARVTARRALPRTARYARTSRRYQSTSDSTKHAAAGASSGAVAGGIAGGLAVAALGYGIYYFSGARTMVNTVQQTRDYANHIFKKSTENAPKPSEAVQWLRSTVTSYTQFIPGASPYVDKAFQDIEKVQEKHKDEVEKIINDTYSELKDVTKAGVSLAAASQAWEVLQKALKKVGHLAGDAAEDILDNHPELKEKVGGQYQQLKQMAKSYGPEAKKQVDDTVNQVKDIMKGGFSADNLAKIQKLVQEKVEEIKKYGDKAWQEGLKQAQPILDKQPELKKALEQNRDKLLQGDLGQLWTKLQEAIKSGNTDDVQKFVKEQVSKAGDGANSKMGGSLGALLGMFPKDLSSKFHELQEIGQKHGKEAENLLNSAFEDIKKVLEQKVQEGKELKDKAAKDVKS